MNVRNEIKAQIVRADYTMQEVVDRLSEEYGWSDSVSNLSAKLQRESIRYPNLERGMSASETGRDHIPPRVFKQMTHLTKQMQKLDAMLSDVKLTNYKVRATQIADFLEKYIPDVAAMETQMKKYEKCFTTAESEKKALKKKNADLSEALKKSQQESILKKMQELRLQNDYKQAKAILDRIPPEIIKAYTQRSTMKKEVDQYNTLE